MRNLTILSILSQGSLISFGYKELFIAMKDADLLLGANIESPKFFRIPIPLLKFIGAFCITSSELVFNNGERYYLMSAININKEEFIPRHLLSREIFKYIPNKNIKY